MTNNTGNHASILIAGIGNIFLGDDAFGVEVVHRLLKQPLPAGVRAIDFGIRGFDLACALMEGYRAAILVDAVYRGGRPGTLYVLEPEVLHSAKHEEAPYEAHSLHPARVIQYVQAIGGRLPAMRLVACEPTTLGSDPESPWALSPPVAAAVGPAVSSIRYLLTGFGVDWTEPGVLLESSVPDCRAAHDRYHGPFGSMHELAITQEIVELACRRAGGSKITRIVLRIGQLSTVLPDAVRFCFELCSEGTAAQGARLEIHEPDGRARCRSCGSDLSLDPPYGMCACGSSEMEWIAGEELCLEAVEVI